MHYTMLKASKARVLTGSNYADATKWWMHCYSTPGLGSTALEDKLCGEIRKRTVQTKLMK